MRPRLSPPPTAKPSQSHRRHHTAERTLPRTDVLDAPAREPCRMRIPAWVRVRTEFTAPRCAAVPAAHRGARGAATSPTGPRKFKLHKREHSTTRHSSKNFAPPQPRLPVHIHSLARGSWLLALGSLSALMYPVPWSSACSAIRARIGPNIYSCL